MGLPLNLFWAQLLLSSDILRTMDQTANPCDDFYQFACGNYSRRVQLPEDEASMDNFVEVGKRINKELQSVIEEPISKTDPKSHKMVKIQYKSCMNVKELERLGLEPWKAVIKHAGGWPMVMGSEWTGEGYDWMKTFGRFFREYSVAAILSIDVGTDSKNSSRHILEIDKAGLGLGKREYYLESNHSHILEAYREYMLGTALQLGADNKTAEKDVQDLLDFETQLANISVKDEDRTNYTELYNLITVGELKEMFPKLPLQTFFDDMIKHGWNLSDSTEVNVVGGPYMEALPDILAKTDKRVLANYQMWDIVRGFLFYIAPSLKDNYRKFREAIYGVKTDKERWEDCVNAVFGDLGLTVAAMYVKRYFKNDAKTEMDRIVGDIRKAMELTLINSHWMDDKTRDFALHKLSVLVEKIGYPEYIFNESRLLRDKEYVKFKENHFMENAVALSRTGFNTTKRVHQTLVNRSDWEINAADVNAIYSLDFNAISFPAAILQYPFFVSYAPIYINYGRIGCVVGHEITHGYDDEGRQFGGDGNLISWWTDKTLENFTNGSKCFISQYGGIIDQTTGYKLNGELELGENIADNGGVKLSYQAYKKRYSEKYGDSEKSLQGLENFTPDQLFFVSYGQLYCEIIRKEALQETIISDVHAPSRYRVNVPLRNFQAFSDAFNCPSGSFMNPEDKCSIW